MKMSILAIEYKNIRKIGNLKLSFTNPDGSAIENNFIMMANGTGKTTTMELIKGLFDGTIPSWPPDLIKSYQPASARPGNGEFNITVKFDEKQYKYFAYLDYKSGTAEIRTTTSVIGGQEQGLHLPEALTGIFSPEFVRRFVFDGEQAARSMDSSSNEAEETIKYLYRLDELDEIIAQNKKILTDIQSAEGNKGSSYSLKNLRTRQDRIDQTRKKLKERADCLRKGIKVFEDEKRDKEKQRREIDKNYEQLNHEKNDIQRDLERNKSDIEAKISELLMLIKFPYLLSREMCNRMTVLGNSMTKLKLPKSSSKDFFVELSNSPLCVCGRCIGDKEKEAILQNAEHYLGNDQQSILNSIKSSLIGNVYDSRLEIAFAELGKLREETNRLNTRYNNNEEKLVKAGGEEAAQLKARMEELIEWIGVSRSKLEIIESKDEGNDGLTEDNNLHKADLAYHRYEQQIASATRTNAALHRKETVDILVKSIKGQATAELKKEIIRKTNEKLKRVIKDDYIEIENIDRYIKLKGRDGASEAQTLSIAYCFLGTLFEDSELEFPFIIDSPTGKMDFDKRQAIADIIPLVFNQMIAFVQSAEVERFADRFYDKPDSQFITIIASPDGSNVEIHNGIEFFDSYQREHKGDE